MDEEKETEGWGLNFKGINMSSRILSCRTHEHRFWELIYQVDFPTVATVGGKHIRVNVGELIVIPPQTPHDTSGDVPFRDVSMQVESFDFPTVPTVIHDNEGHIRALLDVMASHRDDRSAESAILLEHLSEAVLLCVKNITSAEREPSAVAHFKRILWENVGNPYFDLGSAIDALGYHPDYFRRSFKRCTLISPLAYLNRMRIGRAKDMLLLEPSLSVGEIALRCGFRDPLYFSTAFRRAVGFSPLEYRKQQE